MPKRGLNPRVLFFLMYSRDQASSRVRGFYMAEELKKRNLSCDLVYGYGKMKYANFLLKLLKNDIIYFQKRYTKNDMRLNRIAQSIGKKTIFDIDDNPAGANLNLESEERAIEMIKISSAVAAGSHKLKEFAQKFNDNVYLIPSSIYLDYYKPEGGEKKQDCITLGWIGNGAGYKKDLEMLINPLKSIGKKYRIKLVLIGALGQKEIYENFGRLKNIQVEITDWLYSTDPYVVPKAISKFDIGLYPLLNNEYNQYKCSLKALEYMAMKVPVILSPVGENKVVIEAGKDGFLPSNEKEWEENILYLIENKDARIKMGEMGRKKIEKYYALDVCASKLINVLEKIKQE